jgi:hypothetical protein
MLSDPGSETNRSKIAARNGFDVLLKLAHVDDAEVQTFAAAGLASLVDTGVLVRPDSRSLRTNAIRFTDERRSRLVSKGGIGVLLRLAQASDPKARSYAAVALCSMAENGWRQEPDPVQSTAHEMRAATVSGKIVESGGAEALAQLIRADEPDVRAYGVAAIANLAQHRARAAAPLPLS